MSDPNETFSDPGYDPSGDLGVVHEKIAATLVPGPKYVISSAMLPPVGMQGIPSDLGAPGSCAAWASTYGLATAAAARAGNYNPRTSDVQASPAFIYIQVIGIAAPPCKGSAMKSYFAILEETGTPNLWSAPYFPNCLDLVNTYHDPPNPPACDLSFKRPQPTPIECSDAASIKQALSQNRPVAYGTRLYNDFGAYRGAPAPYVGSGTPKIGKDGKPSRHCMMIIGYDDTMPYTNRKGKQQKGAYYVQNSFGIGWGASGYFWIAYESYLDLMETTCFAY